MENVRDTQRKIPSSILKSFPASFDPPGSYAMVNTYPQVMIIDNTYKMTLYNMPLLETVGQQAQIRRSPLHTHL